MSVWPVAAVWDGPSVGPAVRPGRQKLQGRRSGMLATGGWETRGPACIFWEGHAVPVTGDGPGQGGPSLCSTWKSFTESQFTSHTARLLHVQTQGSLVGSRICVPTPAVRFRTFQHPQRKPAPLDHQPQPPSPRPPAVRARPWGPALPGPGGLHSAGATVGFFHWTGSAGPRPQRTPVPHLVFMGRGECSIETCRTLSVHPLVGAPPTPRSTGKGAGRAVGGPPD